MSTGGMKFDTGKADLSLIPLSAQLEEAKGFMLGEKKYGRYNFTQGLKASRLVAAALRHILQWQQGEDLDPESGASHLGHARCCLAMIIECERLGTLIDDRHHVLNPKAVMIPLGSGIRPEDLQATASQIKTLAKEGHSLGNLNDSDTADIHLKRYQDITGYSSISSPSAPAHVVTNIASPVVEASKTAHHSTSRLPDGSEVTWWTPPSDFVDYLK